MYPSEADFRELWSLLCTNSPRKIALHLRQLLKDSSERELSNLLFKAIELGKVRPSVCDILLSVAKSPVTLIEAIAQTNSTHIRRVGIKRLGKVLEADNGETFGMLSEALKDFFHYSQHCRPKKSGFFRVS